MLSRRSRAAARRSLACVTLRVRTPRACPDPLREDTDAASCGRRQHRRQTAGRPGVRLDDRWRDRRPTVSRSTPRRHVHPIKRVVTVAVSRHRLDLDQRIIGAQANRHVAAGEPHVGEQRAEPAVGLDDALRTGRSRRPEAGSPGTAPAGASPARSGRSVRSTVARSPAPAMPSGTVASSPSRLRAPRHRIPPRNPEAAPRAAAASSPARRSQRQNTSEPSHSSSRSMGGNSHHPNAVALVRASQYRTARIGKVPQADRSARIGARPRPVSW